MRSMMRSFFRMRRFSAATAAATGPATFYADDRRMNVAISRARDAVYLVGDVDYIASKRLPVLEALIKLPVLIEHSNEDV